jgi:hypothetical protein
MVHNLFCCKIALLIAVVCLNGQHVKQTLAHFFLATANDSRIHDSSGITEDCSYFAYHVMHSSVTYTNKNCKAR